MPKRFLPTLRCSDAQTITTTTLTDDITTDRGSPTNIFRKIAVPGVGKVKNTAIKSS